MTTMTSPDPTSPVTDSRTTTDDAGASDVLDAGTFDRVIEPRSENRLQVGDGAWHQVSPKYVAVQLLGYGLLLAAIVVGALVAVFALELTWVWVPASIAAVLVLAVLVITPRQARAIGYRLREDDLVFRRGILWQRVVAVPYGRLQLVDITHGPLDRVFGIAQLKLVTAAVASGVNIPGLPQEAAEHLRDVLIEVAETRRTGL